MEGEKSKSNCTPFFYTSKDDQIKHQIAHHSFNSQKKMK